MLKEILGIGGAIGAGVATYIIAHRKGHDAGKAEGFESGVQVGFTMAPSLYSQMKINGDIDDIPIGMNLGEVGRAFKTKEEAFEFARKLIVLTGCKSSDITCLFSRDTTGNTCNMYIVAYDKMVDSGRE